jgi:adenylate cyclase
VFGTVGASAHYEYRAVGDIVNTASRIQDLNKRLRTSALLSANAWEGSEEFLTRKLGAFRLAGKDSAVVVYELLGARGQAADTLLIELSAQFADALDRFVHRDWAEAGRGFARILERFPGDGPSLYYVKLCQAYALRGLGDDWDGSVDE